MSFFITFGMIPDSVDQMLASLVLPINWRGCTEVDIMFTIIIIQEHLNFFSSYVFICELNQIKGIVCYLPEQLCMCPILGSYISVIMCPILV